MCRDVGALHLEIFELEPILDRLDSGHVDFAMSFGFRIRGRCHGPLVATKDEGGTGSYGDATTPMVRRWLPLDEYMKSMSVFWGGRRITRRDIIKYVANRDGGAHHGQRQMKAEVEQALTAMHETLAHVGGYPPLYVELVACIQAIISSPSVMEPFRLRATPSPLFDLPSDARNEQFTRPARTWMAFNLGTKDDRR